MGSHYQHAGNEVRGYSSVLLEDDPRYQEMLARSLADEGIRVINPTHVPDQVVELVKQHYPELAFIDLRIFPDDQAGIHVIRQIKAIAPQTKCIVLTGIADDDLFDEAINAGADAFVRKEDAYQPSITDLIKKVMRGEFLLDSYFLRRSLSRRQANSDVAQEAKVGEMSLGSRERAVLMLLAQDKTNKEIGHELHISPNTVKVYLHKLRIRLEVAGGHGARRAVVQAALSKGWLKLSDRRMD